MKLTSKQRAYLMSLASTLQPMFHIGKSGLTPENTDAISECFNNNELIKIDILNNCDDDPRMLAEALAERTRSTLVKVIGKKIIIYKPFNDKPKIQLPKSVTKNDKL